MLIKVVCWLGMTALTAWLGYATRRQTRFEERETAWLIGLLATVVLLRLPFFADVERNIDTSTWLASVGAVRDFPDKLWVWLNYTDSRPLTVLPLLLVDYFVKPDYLVAECVALALTIGTLTFLHQTVRRFLEPTSALLLTAAGGLFWGTVHFGDYVAYNSEQISVLMLAGAIWGYFRYGDSSGKSGAAVFGLGLLLGCLPYAKMQNVPMGLVITGFLGWEILRRKRFGQAALLGLGGVLPTATILGIYASRGATEVFWNDYFWNYFYYSYTADYSSLTGTARFSLWRIARYVYGGSRESVGYATALTGGLLAAGVWAFRFGKKPTPAVRRAMVFGLVFLAVSLYAVLQAGNFFQHYLSYFFFALLLATGLTLSLVSPGFQKKLGLILLGLVWVQGSYNLLTQRPPMGDFTRQHRPIAQFIQQLSRPGEALLVWGYADGLYPLADRPPAFHRITTYWLYHPEEGLHAYRLRQFLEQMERHQPRLVVDVQTPGRSLDGEERYRLTNFPEISRYVLARYWLVGEVEGVRVYRKK
ncbi:MAG: hypothetical protein H7Y12_07535 [Sphingobacteriaceae bacterium]|nr:hypothetical protein [Cytophagaceae bacterium]